jgi:hypothetical protein
MQFASKKHDDDDNTPNALSFFFLPATQLCEKEEDAQLVHCLFFATTQPYEKEEGCLLASFVLFCYCF